MFFRFPSSALLVAAGLFLVPIPSSFAQETSSSYKVLASQKAGLNLDTVRNYIEQGDQSTSNNELKQAVNHYKKARKTTKLLLSFYRDLNGSFRGLDARIPREMDSKGREAQVLLSKTNLRLAALYRRQNQSEVAVPLLVEVVKLMSPTKAEGQKAYQSLLELGFVETPYAGMRKTN